MVESFTVPSLLTLEELYRPVQAELDEVRSAVADVWDETFRLVQVRCTPRPLANGKMVRPALCLLSAGATGAEDLFRFVPLAVTFELLHTAALAHDDVVDGSSLRRGTTSLNAMWDDRTAVLSGDYLVGRAMTLMAGYGSCAVLASAVECMRKMAEGELSSFGLKYAGSTQEDCLRIAEKKTASLFETACVAPTFLINEAFRDAVGRFGMAFGIAFQLIDDILDLSQSEAALGKPACTDIVEGKRTIPLLFLRDALQRDDLTRLDAMRRATITESDRAWIVEALDRTGARERTETMARAYVDEARLALDDFPSSPAKESMLGLAEFILARDW